MLSQGLSYFLSLLAGPSKLVLEETKVLIHNIALKKMLTLLLVGSIVEAVILYLVLKYSHFVKCFP